eukprot:s989_g13.t2
MERPRLAKAASFGSLGSLPQAGKVVTKRGIRLEDLCRPRLGRGSVKTNGRAFHKPFEVAYREIAELRNFRRLENLFLEADADRSGEMSLDEFRNALRKPWVQRSFSLLGVQPHQAEVVFKKMNRANAEEISIADFIGGLESILGTDLDGPPRDLDVSSLSFRLKAKTRELLAGDGAENGETTETFGAGQSMPDLHNLGSKDQKHISAAMAVLSPTSIARKEKKDLRRRGSSNTVDGYGASTADLGSPTSAARSQASRNSNAGGTSCCPPCGGKRAWISGHFDLKALELNSNAMTIAAGAPPAPPAPPAALLSAEEIESREREAVDAYCRKHDIKGLVEDLVSRYLLDRPKDMNPHEYFAQQLRLQMLAGDEAHLVEAATKVPGYALRQLFEATKRITSEIVPKETIRVIIEESLKVLNCDRISLFIYDKRIEMLVLNASNLEHPIRVRPGQGIAGKVFNSKQTVNIADCYKDARFDQSFDKETGYVTRHLLAFPIIDFEGNCLGVIQAINKDGGQGFGPADEILLSNLAEHVSVAVHNAEFYRAAIVTSERANALLQMMQSLTHDLGAQSLVLSVATHASTLVRADRCSVFLVDERADELISIANDSGVEIRIPKSHGIAGECASENKLIVIDDAYEDARFNPEYDEKTGYRTHSIIAVPVRKPPTKDKACAVIQMINKQEFDDEIGRFDDEDVQVLETYAMFVATQLAQSSLLKPANSKASNFNEGMARDLSHNRPHGLEGHSVAAIREEE